MCCSFKRAVVVRPHAPKLSDIVLICSNDDGRHKRQTERVVAKLEADIARNDAFVFAG